MKKIIFFVMALAFVCVYVVKANPPAGSYSTGTGNQQCNGCCIEVWNADGKTTHWECVAPEGSATKDCVRAGGGIPE